MTPRLGPVNPGGGFQHHPGLNISGPTLWYQQLVQCSFSLLSVFAQPPLAARFSLVACKEEIIDPVW
jgi:hypothetical protein